MPSSKSTGQGILRWIAVLPGAILAGILVTFPVHWVALLIHHFGGSGDSFITVDDKSLVAAMPLEMLERFGYALVVPATIVVTAAWIAPRFHFITAVVMTVLIGCGLTFALLQLQTSGSDIRDPAWRIALLVVFWLISITVGLFRARELDKEA